MTHDESNDSPAPKTNDETIGYSHEQPIDRVIAAYLQALQAGDKPDPQDWLDRYPDLAAELAEFFADRARSERTAQPVRTAVGSMVRYIGDYELLEELGRGGMGVVYKARQVSLKRLVALKMILAGAHASAHELARFRAEAEAVAQLQHPHIVQIHEIGEHEGHPYAALEYVQGGSLAQKLDGTPLPARQAAQLVEVLANAVEAAHQRGIVHRDLKPANVLLTGVGEPKITDFGLAKLMKEDSGQTRTGAILGTPSYMAPEQAEGKSHEVGPAADIYALGAIIYELLTGRPPFRAATPLETIKQVVTDEPVAPTRLHSKIPSDLETICLKCLHKEPRRRYASALALAADLGCWREGKPIAARPVSRTERLGKWVKRHPTGAGLVATAAALLLVVSIGGPVAAYWQAQLREQAETAKELADNRATAEERARADALMQKKRADDKAAEADRQHGETAKALLAVTKAQDETHAKLQLAQAHLFTAQLMRVAPVCARDPFLGFQLLHNYDACPIDKRDTAWRCLARLCQHHHVPLPHPAEVLAVAFQPDGQVLATAAGSKVTLWHTATGQDDGVLEHPQRVSALAYSPDGTTLAVAHGPHAGAGELTLWNTATRQQRVTRKGHGRHITSLRFHAEGMLFATAGADSQIRFWDALTGQPRGVLKHTTTMHDVAFSPDGKTLASASYDKTVLLWDVATRRLLTTLTGHRQAVRSVAFSPDGKTLASGSDDWTIKLWDAATGTLRASLPAEIGSIVSLAFSPDGQTLASGQANKLVKLWDPATGQERTTLWGHTNLVLCVTFSPDGRSLASASADTSARLWDAAPSQPRAVLLGHASQVTSVAYSPDGRTLASGSSDKSVSLWDVATGRQRSRLQGHTMGVNAVAYSADGKTLASASNDRTIRLWDVATGQVRAQLQGHTGQVTALAFSADGQRLVSGSIDSTAKLWDVVTGQELATHKENTHVQSVAFHPDGRTVALSISVWRTIALWDVKAGKSRLLHKHVNPVTSVAFSPDGRTLASASNDQILLWSLPAGEPRANLRGHGGPIHRVAFSPDGATLASVGDDATLKLWNVATGQERTSLRGHTTLVCDVAFAPNGSTLATAGSWDRSVRLWDASPVQPHAVFEDVRLPLSDAQFLSARPLLRTMGPDATRSYWDLRTGQPSQEALQSELRAWRNLLDGHRFLGMPTLYAAPVREPPYFFHSADGKWQGEVRRDSVWVFDKTLPAEQARWQQHAELLHHQMPAWHQLQAEQARQDTRWFATAHHLGKLADRRPWDAQLRRDEAHAWVQAGQHGRAALASVRAVLLNQ